MYIVTTVPRSKIWEALITLGIYEHLLNIIMELCKNNTGPIKKEAGLSEPRTINKRLRQSYNMSPLLFNVYLEIALEKWKGHRKGIGLPVGNETVISLDFAEDQVVIAQDAFVFISGDYTLNM